MMRERLLKSVYCEPDLQLPLEKQRAPYNEDVIEAAENIVMLDFALLRAAIETGMCKKTPETLAQEIRYDPCRLNPRGDRRNVAPRGIVPTATVEQMAPQKPA